MSNDELTVEQIEHQINVNRGQYNREAARIEADEELTPQGKLNRLTELENVTRERHQVLRRAHGEAVKAERDAIYARTFQRGMGSIDSYRGVYSQANAVDDEKGLERLKAQAVNTGDSLLLKAVYHVSYDRGYVSLLGDAPDSVRGLLEFEYEHGLRRAVGTDRTRQLQKRLERDVRISAPHR